MKVKNLLSLLLLLVILGICHKHIPYILFKLEEIKKSEVVSFFRHALSCLVTNALSLFFTFESNIIGIKILLKELNSVRFVNIGVTKKNAHANNYF